MSLAGCVARALRAYSGSLPVRSALGKFGPSTRRNCTRWGWFRSEYWTNAWISLLAIFHARYLTLWFRKGNVGGGMFVENITAIYVS